jgi:GNAT superfamily N-acetyltransferase
MPSLGRLRGRSSSSGRLAVVQIRDAGAQDREALRGVFRRSSLSNEGDRASLLAHPEVLEFQLPGPESRVRVAVLDGSVAGFATTRVLPGGRLELDDLFVDPGAKREGIGTALIEDVDAWAQAQGWVSIEVTANPDALAFYERVGFRLCGAVETRFGSAPRMRRPVRPAPD